MDLNVESVTPVENCSTSNSPPTTVIQNDTLEDDQHPGPEQILDPLTLDKILVPYLTNHSTKIERIQPVVEKSPLLTCENGDQTFPISNGLLCHEISTHVLENLPTIFITKKDDGIISTEVADINTINISSVELLNESMNTIENIPDSLTNESFRGGKSFKYLDEMSFEPCKIEINGSSPSGDTDDSYLNVPIRKVEDSSSIDIIGDVIPIWNEIESKNMNEFYNKAGCDNVINNRNYETSSPDSSNDKSVMDDGDFEGICIGIDEDSITQGEESAPNELNGRKLDETFTPPRSLRCHAKQQSHKPSGSSKSKLKCTKCNYHAEFKHNLNHHMQTRHSSLVSCSIVTDKDDFEGISIGINEDTTTQRPESGQESAPNKSSSREHDKPCTTPRIATRRSLRSHAKQQSHEPAGSLKSELKCTKCDYRAESKNNLNHHMQTQHSGRVSCPTCGKSCTNNVSYLLHHKRYHSGKHPSTKVKKLYICCVCQKQFGNKLSFEAHQRYHSRGYQHVCQQCGKLFLTEKGMHIHAALGHGTDQSPVSLDCDKCDYRAIHRDNLEYHKSTKHTDPFICSICGKSLRGKKEYHRHLRRYHKGDQFTCAHCGEHFGYKRQLMSHILNHLMANKCEKCGKGFRTKLALNLHKRTHTSVSQKVIKCNKCDFNSKSRWIINQHMVSQHDTDGSIQCDSCSQWFKNKKSLQAHDRLVHIKPNNKLRGVQVEPKRRPRCVSDELEPLTCNDCGSSFWTRALLLRHIRVQHVVEEFVCQVCNKTFRIEENLKLHVENAHNRRNEYTCQICDYKCLASNRLQLHFRIHTGEKPYVCGVCDKSFMYKNNLTKHQKTHQEDGHLTCDHCQEKFSTKITLREHIIGAHMSAFKCTKCHMTFSTEGDLYSHENAHTSEGNLLPQEWKNAHTSDGNLVPQKWICKVCGEACSTESHLDSHQRVHWLTCNHCQESFESKETLIRHLRSHEPAENVAAETCGKTWTNGGNLNSRRKARQNQDLTGKTSSNRGNLSSHKKAHQQQDFTCETCGKTFTYASYLHMHRKIHQKPGNSCETCGETFTYACDLRKHRKTHRKKELTCEPCGKTFNNRGNWVLHNRFHEKPYNTCEVCGKSYTLRNSLIQHRISHRKKEHSQTSLERTTCKECGEICFDISGLALHQKVHAVEVVTCQTCHEKFVDIRTLEEHQIRAHQPEPMYTCQICDYKYGSLSDLTVHFRTHTGETPYPCEQCDLSFSTENDLVLHRMNKHLKQIERTFDSTIALKEPIAPVVTDD